MLREKQHIFAFWPTLWSKGVGTRFAPLNPVVGSLHVARFTHTPLAMHCMSLHLVARRCRSLHLVARRCRSLQCIAYNEVQRCNAEVSLGEYFATLPTSRHSWQ